MPAVIIPFSLLAVLPFIGLGLVAVGGTPDNAELGLAGLIDYAALLLAFSGGVHWGLALAPDSARPAWRAATGLAPMVIAWSCLILSRFVAPGLALGTLCAAYLATILVEQRAARRFLLASRYVWVRWMISLVAVTAMVAVLILRATGQTIVF